MFYNVQTFNNESITIKRESEVETETNLPLLRIIRRQEQLQKPKEPKLQKISDRLIISDRAFRICSFRYRIQKDKFISDKAESIFRDAACFGRYRYVKIELVYSNKNRKDAFNLFIANHM